VDDTDEAHRRLRHFWPWLCCSICGNSHLQLDAPLWPQPLEDVAHVVALQ
jgi:hypothetical protein